MSGIRLTCYRNIDSRFVRYLLMFENLFEFRIVVAGENNVVVR